VLYLSRNNTALAAEGKDLDSVVSGLLLFVGVGRRPAEGVGRRQKAEKQSGH
jgi:hypothetical protein